MEIFTWLQREMSKVRHLNSCLFRRIRVGLFSQEPAQGGKLDLAGGLGASHDSQVFLSSKHCDSPGFPGAGFSRWEAAGHLRMGTWSSPPAGPAIPVALSVLGLFRCISRNCHQTARREPGCVMLGATGQ